MASEVCAKMAQVKLKRKNKKMVKVGFISLG